MLQIQSKSYTTCTQTRRLVEVAPEETDLELDLEDRPADLYLEL